MVTVAYFWQTAYYLSICKTVDYINEGDGYHMFVQMMLSTKSGVQYAASATPVNGFSSA